MSGHERTETLRALVVCDSAIPPRLWRDDGRSEIPVTSIGARRELNLHVTELGTVVLERFDSRANDLVRIAAYVFAADQLLSRGGRNDPHRRRWVRDLAMVMPVLTPEFWSQPAVTEALRQALAFGTDDYWSFHFTEAQQQAQQLHLEFDEEAEHRDERPDSVILLSGGIDSLCATVDAVTSGLSPIVVSHRAAIHTASPQRHLVDLVRHRFQSWSFPHLSFRVHQRGEEARERTRRTRGFLFAALGAAVAGQLAIPRVLLSDNGYVSLNPPINAQLVGALNSRGTHPTFLRLVNRLLELVFPDGVVVENSLADRTRAEALQILKEHGCADLLRQTRSCANSRMPGEQPHCGVCSQCVDRRFATIHAGMDGLDPVDRYRVDIFRDALPEGTPKTFAASYVGFARRTVNATPDDLWLDLPELDQCLDMEGPDPSASAGRAHRVLTQHAHEVLGVLASEVQRASHALARGTLDQNSLLLLAIGSTPPFDRFDSQPLSSDNPVEAGSSVEQDPAPLPIDDAVLPGARLVDRPSDEAMAPTGTKASLDPVSQIERHSTGWWIQFDEEKALLPNQKGVRQLVTLLKSPWTDVPSLNLFQEVAVTKPSRPDPDVTGSGDSRGGDVIDGVALKEYTAQLNTLRAQRQDAEVIGDIDGMTEIDDTMSWLAAQIRAGRGKGGRLRQFSTGSEKARVAVSHTLNTTLSRIEREMPNLHEHLQSYLHLGAICRYEPELPRRWTVKSR